MSALLSLFSRFFLLCARHLRFDAAQGVFAKRFERLCPLLERRRLLGRDLDDQPLLMPRARNALSIRIRGKLHTRRFRELLDCLDYVRLDALTQ